MISKRKRRVIELVDKIDRAIGMLKCLGLAVENEEAMNYLHKPHWYLIEKIEEDLLKISEEIKEL